MMSTSGLQLRRGWLKRLPASYRPGSLLVKLRYDLASLEFEPYDDTRAQFRCDESGLAFLAEECVEARFLMHVVTTRFSCHIPYGGGRPARIRVRHRGAWKRTGIECTTEQDDGEAAAVRQIADRLASDFALTSSMLPLDFTSFQLERHEAGWIASLVHYGASEVVYQFPSTRQYVRLSREQVEAILRTFARLSDLLGQSTRTVLASE
jgi:hypothetical protein